MSNESIEQIEQWSAEYFQGYYKFMIAHHPELYNKFEKNIHPPQRIGGGPTIGKSARNTEEDYIEILRITKEFCQKYQNPINFPKDF